MKAKDFDRKFDDDIDISATLEHDKATRPQREHVRAHTEATPPKRLGLMAGRIKVPDNFDSMGSDEIDSLFNGET